MATDDRKKVTVPIRIRKTLLPKIKAYGNMHDSYSDVIERLLSKKTAEQEKEETDLVKRLDGVM